MYTIQLFYPQYTEWGNAVCCLQGMVHYHFNPPFTKLKLITVQWYNKVCISHFMGVGHFLATPCISIFELRDQRV